MRGVKANAVLMLLIAGNACAEIVATCGESVGKVYFPKSEHGAEFNGWHDDGIDGGSLQLIRSISTYDIIYTDAIGSTGSMRADTTGFSAWTDDAGNLFIVATYRERVESFVFWLSRKDSPVVSFSIARGGGMLDKHGLYVAPCRLGK